VTARRASTSIERFALMKISHRLGDSSLRLALWDGASCGAPATSARTTVTINDSPTLFALVWSPAMAFGDGYSGGQIRVTGDLKYLLEVAYRLPDSRRPWPSLGLVNSLKRSWENVHHHYDLGNDFYQSWLDEELVYTCAYFEDDAERGAAMTLEAAQRAKLDLVCRKLALEPGQHVVEAGCGWGALAIYMARHYGVTVRAFNISSEQIAFARRRAHDAGVDHLVEFVQEDYRTIDGHCDRFVSVGMLEHVGVRHFAALGDVIHRVLDGRRGRGLLHFIGRNRPEPLSRWITTRIFPGAYPPSLAEATTGVLEPHRFSVLDVENLRLHYARTLEHWQARYDRVMPRVASQYGERFARAWQLYLTGSTVGFTSGTLQLFQVTFAREPDNTVPMTRAALYRRDQDHGTC
jgi:cyclopropane-fatty-acyl-phospholipid synthase